MRRSLGFALEVPGRMVEQFAGHLDTLGATHVTIDLAVAWATAPAGAAPYYHWLRLNAVRGFARYLHGIDAAHQIPPADVLPRNYHRRTPCLLSATGIAALIDAAGKLRPALHAATYQALIGLLAIGGMFSCSSVVKVVRHWCSSSAGVSRPSCTAMFRAWISSSSSTRVTPRPA